MSNMIVMSSLSDTRKWTGRVVTWVLLLHLVCLSHGGVVLDLQAEDTVGYDPANARWRSNASNARSVLLQRDGDFLRFVICLPSDMQVFVEDVRYSTDGWSKIGAILVDEQEVNFTLFFTLSSVLFLLSSVSFTTYVLFVHLHV